MSTMPGTGIAANRTDFLKKVTGVRRWLADTTPPMSAIALLCDRRTTFLCGLAAAVAETRPVLLPNDGTPHTLAALEQALGPLTVVDDTLLDSLAPAPAQPLFLRDDADICLFTSGSTGTPVAHHRRWGSLAMASAGWREVLNLGQEGASIIATVPAQHMFGFETAAVLPLLHDDITVHDLRPFYPADIVRALSEMAGPRLLVTTPVHLDVLCRSGLALPRLHGIVSATAPLSASLAARAEAAFQAPVTDIYGSTETGMIASRQPARSDIWTPRRDVSLTISGDGKAVVRAAHLPVPVPLADLLDPCPDGRFRLIGRDADMLNIAGKRASLAGLTQHLLALPGVEDAAMVMPEAVNGIGRPVAVLVAPHLNASTVQQHLRKRVADAFVPRRVVFVDQIPRTSVGKLGRSALLALISRADVS